MKNRIGSLLLIIFLCGFIDPVYDKNEKAMDLYKAKNYVESSKLFKEVDRSNRDKTGFNLGTSLINEGKIDEGITFLSRELNKTKDKNYISDIYYNIGNGYYKEGKYDKAVENYKNSLKFNPDKIDAKTNLELALMKLKETNKDQKKEDKKQNKDDKDKEDKNKSKQEKQHSQKQQKQEQGKMSLEDAKRMVDSFDQKKINLMPLKEIKVQPKKIEKDW
ncbi:MAG: tetratricopeptide repeat protein [Candidatus Hydrogenedentota bacterium]